ncbi:MAG: hypothetical protein QXI60_05635 [Thermofilaceae archaeon]
MNPIATALELIERDLNQHRELIPIYEMASQLTQQLLDKRLSLTEYRMKMLQLAEENRSIFLHLVATYGVIEVVANKMGIPLTIWLEYAQGDPEFDVTLKNALEAGEMNLMHRIMSQLQMTRVPSSTMRSLSEYLKLRRPERYNVKVTRTVSKEELAREILAGIEVALLQALNEAGVSADVQAKIIDAFRSRLRKSNQ